MATFNPGDWQPGFDEFGRPCWHNKATKSRVYNQFPPETPAGLSSINAAGPNVPARPSFNPASPMAAEALWKQALAKAWKEYETDGDEKERRRYWYNSMSGETTWEQPETPRSDKPPPPPSPPTQPKEPAPPVKKERESDQWKRSLNGAGRKYWYNETTGESQFEKPDCMRKYR